MIARLGAKVKVGYFAQAHETLSEAKTLVDEVVWPSSTMLHIGGA